MLSFFITGKGHEESRIETLWPEDHGIPYLVASAQVAVISRRVRHKILIAGVALSTELHMLFHKAAEPLMPPSERREVQQGVNIGQYGPGRGALLKEAATLDSVWAYIIYDFAGITQVFYSLMKGVSLKLGSVMVGIMECY